MRQVVVRVLGTVIGAVTGLLILSIPGVLHEPLLMLACVGAATLCLGLVTRTQTRVTLVLATFTMCAVALCSYEAACCSAQRYTGSMTQFVARLSSVRLALAADMPPQLACVRMGS